MMELLREYKEYLLLSSGKSYRTIAAYGKHIEDYLLYLHGKYAAIELDMTTSQEMQQYLLGLQHNCISTAMYTQVLSALASWCCFLERVYQKKDLVAPKSSIIMSFPIACSESKIVEVLHRLKSSFEDTRLKLIIRLMYMYKVPLVKLMLCRKGMHEGEVLVDTKKIKLSLNDQGLLKDYLEKLTQLVPYASSSDALFITKGTLGAKPITKQIIWSILKRAFVTRNRQWFA